MVTQQLAANFSQDPAKIVTAVVEMPGPADSPAAGAQLADYARRLGTVPGVTGSSVTGTYANQARVTLNYTLDPMSRQATTLVDDLRAQAAPAGATTLFTGMPASRVDIVNIVTSRLPWMLLFVVVVSFVLRFLAFGSLVIPLKSIMLNLLSLSASLGVVKLIFQDGNLSGLLGFTPVGAIDVNFPVLIVAIAFGLAMDYETF